MYIYIYDAMDIVCYISIFILRISIDYWEHTVYIYISIIPVFIYSAITVSYSQYFFMVLL